MLGQAPTPIAAPVLESADQSHDATTVPLPGLTERILVVVAVFTFNHQTPNAWFLSAADEGRASNPIYIAVMLGLIGLAFARILGYFDLLISTIRLEPAVYLFTGLVVASLFWSADPVESAKGAIIFGGVTIYASYLVMRFSLDQIIRLLSVMFTISAFLNMAFVVAFPQFGIDEDGLWTGVFGQKNALGYIAALAIPALIVASRAWRGGRFMFYPAIALHLVLLVGSQSKTMLVAALVPTISIVFYHTFRGRRTLPGAVLVGLIGSGTFAVAFATANIGLLADWLDKDVTLTGRVPLWQNLLTVVWERPLLGHGYRATFGGYFSPVHEVWIQNQWNPSHAHNAILQIWLEIGLVGAVIYLVLYFRAISRAVKVATRVDGAVGLWPLVFLTTTMLVSITESGMTSEELGWMMLVIVALTLSGHLKHADEAGGNEPATTPPAASGQDMLGAVRR